MKGSLLDQLNWQNNYKKDSTVMNKPVEPLRHLVARFKKDFPYDKEFNRRDLEELFSEFSVYVIVRLLYILQKQGIIRKTSWSTYIRCEKVEPKWVKVK
jgi:hypothetical protein